ncbi:hypothetical protein MUK60_07475 [Streptomyces sp. LRE541]|uniref:hypothetical protein n=1 Tax=Streptomyces sp. LRE541 TaxID=2931983 RepID=UPI00200E351B|nr:hypothetical protein [Streptomyces sp. LRE541]UPZ27673.1 hypothetical protein MUK60_07475 [Streptomyces sp. LRE541]
MTTFQNGDSVTVVAAGPENEGTVGRTGTVVDDGSLSGGDIAVKGIDGRITETVKGYRSYTADQLRRA